MNRYAWIWAIGSRSGGSGSKDSRSNLDRWFQIGQPGSFAGDNGGDQSPAVSRAAGPRRNSPYSALPGSIQPVLGSGRLRKARVMHLGHLRGVARCGAPCTAAEKVLWRRSCRRARVGNGAGLSGLREHVCWAGVGAGRRGGGRAARERARGGKGAGPGGERVGRPTGFWVGFGLLLSYFNFFSFSNSNTNSG